jgi:hypothetical protein
MKRIFNVALVVGMLIQPTSSIAESFAWAGIGAISCGKIAQDYRQNPTQTENVMLTWAQGFMSGANASIEHGQYRDLAAMTLDAQKESLKTYCDDHPHAEFIKAVMDLYFKLPLKKYTPPTSR